MAPAHQHPNPSVKTRAPASPRRGPAVTHVRVLYLVVAVWLAASPFVLPGPSAAVAVKDVLVAAALVAVVVAAAFSEFGRRLEIVVPFALGALLVTASVALEFGTGPEAVARQWNEVVVGVLLICVSAARAR